MISTTDFQIGVESILPGEADWFATIYGCWFGKYFSEAQLQMALREVGAQFTLFYDSLAPKKPDACRRIAEMCTRLELPFLYNNTYGDIYGPWLEGTGRAEYRPEDLTRAAQTGLFRGVVWDEVEHRQLHGTDTGGLPYFIDARGKSPVQCYDELVAAVGLVVGLLDGAAAVGLSGADARAGAWRHASGTQGTQRIVQPVGAGDRHGSSPAIRPPAMGSGGSVGTGIFLGQLVHWRL